MLCVEFDADACDELIKMSEWLKDFRHELHRHPELSGHEKQTAERIIVRCQQFNPDQIYTGVGGHGVIVAFGSRLKPCVMLRCELDAVPISESSFHSPYSSVNEGVSHKCGHDGHMAILAGVAEKVRNSALKNISVALLFQPMEETGYGSDGVLHHSYFSDYLPERIFALHNVPGYEMGKIISRIGTFSCASRGLTLFLNGSAAHAAQPETGNSPALPLAELMTFADALKTHPELESILSFCTVVGARLGDRAFGTAPESAELYLTLRSETDTDMQRLINLIQQEIERKAKSNFIRYRSEYSDIFDATVNEKTSVELIRKVAGNKFEDLSNPYRWSEDFGRYTQRIPGAMFGLGAGKLTAPLHDSEYDFPDELIEHGVEFFLSLLSACDNEMA